MAVDTIAMLLGLMFGFGHGGGLFSEDWPHHEYYSYAGCYECVVLDLEFFY